MSPKLRPVEPAHPWRYQLTSCSQLLIDYSPVDLDPAWELCGDTGNRQTLGGRGVTWTAMSPAIRAGGRAHTIVCIDGDFTVRAPVKQPHKYGKKL